MGDAKYRLNRALDTDRLAESFRAKGRLHIPDFLAPQGAEHLQAALEAEDGWKLVINQGDKRVELDRALQASLSRDRLAQIDDAVYAAARGNFQFRYETLRAPHADVERAADPTPLNEFARFMSSDAVLAFLAEVTGAADISFADAQGTCYGPGHFLTAHDDKADDQSRRVAWVFNLTRHWMVDWGGLLTFHERGSKLVESFVPSFNALNLFRVPQLHSVGFVAPFALYRRYSVTGWLRAGTPP